MNRAIYMAVLITLVVLVALNWWLPGGPDRPAAGPPLDPRFDYALTEFTARFHDADGALELELAGPRLEHSSETRIARIVEPRFRTAADPVSWQGRSETGLLLRAADELVLTGRVHLYRDDPDDPVDIRSDEIRYLRDRNLAYSPGQAHIKRPGTDVHGGTLSVWLNEDRMELENHVQAEYRAAGPAADHRRR